MTSLFMCCDLNVQVTGEVDGITGPHVHAFPISSLETRDFAFWTLLQLFDMFVCNIFHQCSDMFSYTRVPWGIFEDKLDAATQIDYVCASRQCYLHESQNEACTSYQE